ncbi:MAG: MotA/TolQ/ExbB proton channel family protein [Gammaproteobacteria bacterium]|jgi:biopolymer transport protein ExbB
MKKYFLISLLLPLFLFAQDQEVPVPPSDLDILVDLVKQNANTRKARDDKRVNEFLSQKNRQQYLLNQAKADLKREEDRTARLTKEYEKNDKQLAELEEQLILKLGSLGELFGVVRQVSGDARGHFERSPTNIQFPDRIEFLSELSQTKGVPSVASLERLWFELLNEMNESGKVVTFNSDVLKPNGESFQTEVTRVGTFNAVADGKYLKLLDTQNMFELLSRQPGGAPNSLADDISDPDSGYYEFFIDPSGGSLLSLIIQNPTVFQRINQGGFVGYVIILIGLFGITLGALRFMYLRNQATEIKSELASGSYASESSLGKLQGVFDGFKGSKLEDLEILLEDQLSKLIPPLESGLGTIKLLAAVAPLLGLLGTVIGMIETFQAITLFGTGDPKLMAGGISQALVTTMLGLIMAVPLLFIHNFLDNRSRELVQTLEDQAIGLIAIKTAK